MMRQGSFLRGVLGLEEIPKYQKGWGFEYVIANDRDYCGKELVLYEGKKCSIHYHKIKKETFFVITGNMVVDLYDRPFEVENGDLARTVEELLGTGQLETESVNMTVGDSLLIEPGIPHRFLGLAKETHFMEFSTEHFEWDSYRIWPGDSQTQ